VPDGQRAAAAVGATAADAAQVLADASRPLTLAAIAAALGTRGRVVTVRTLERTAARMVARGAWLDAGPAPSTGGRRARLYALAPDAALALEAEAIGDAARRAVKADAAERAERLALLAAARPADPDAWAAADAARPTAPADVRDAASAARGQRRRRQHPAPRVRTRHATIARSPADVDAALALAAADVPDVPAWMARELAAAASGALDGWPPAVVVDAPPMDTVGAILEAAAALGGHVVEREPMPRPGAPPPALELPAPATLSPAMRASCEADADRRGRIAPRHRFD